LEVGEDKNHPLTPSFAGGGTRGKILDEVHLLRWASSVGQMKTAHVEPHGRVAEIF